MIYTSTQCGCNIKVKDLKVMIWTAGPRCYFLLQAHSLLLNPRVIKHTLVSFVFCDPEHFAREYEWKHFRSCGSLKRIFFLELFTFWLTHLYLFSISCVKLYYPTTLSWSRTWQKRLKKDIFAMHETFLYLCSLYRVLHKLSLNVCFVQCTTFSC